MADRLLKVSIPSVSGIPADESMIDLVYSVDAPSEADYDQMAGIVLNFFDDPSNVIANPLGSYLSGRVSRVAGACEVRFYDIGLHLDGSPAGSPVAVRSFTMPAKAGSAGVDLPAEVAIALSFNADLTDVPETSPNPAPPPAFFRPAARRRGHVSLGPWAAGVIGGDNPSDSRPGTNMQMAIADMGDRHLLDDALTFGWAWQVWSRVDAALYPVVACTVDNAFDTVRSRGVDPTYRYTGDGSP